jgi:hypothetical protein
MVEVGLFGRRARPGPDLSQTIQSRRETAFVLARLDAIVDRLEGVYARLDESLLRDERGQTSGGDGDDGA